MRLRMLTVAAVLALTSCSDADSGSEQEVASSETPTASASATAQDTVAPLPIGKDVLEVDAGTYLSPDGFAPVLRLAVPAGWTSVHRAADAFDLGMPDPEKDAPLVAVVFMSPPEASAAEALEAIRSRATGTVRATRGALGAVDVQALDITGGTGELVASAAGGIALDAAPGQRVRVLAADVGGAPLVVVVLVPDAARWAEVQMAVRQLLEGVVAT